MLKEILAAETTVVSRGITTDNRINLAPSFIKNVIDKYAGTRLGRQELSAEILDDVPDALWTRAALDRDRRKPDQVPSLRRVVVAIDPAAKKNEVVEDGAATGIVVAGVGEDGRGYVLDDKTCRESPNGWARQAIACFDRYEGDCIVGEVNNGGDMVESTVRAVRHGPVQGGSRLPGQVDQGRADRGTLRAGARFACRHRSSSSLHGLGGQVPAVVQDDTQFANGDSDNNWQWDGEVLQSRAGAPSMTINMTLIHCLLVQNDIKKNPRRLRLDRLGEGPRRSLRHLWWPDPGDRPGLRRHQHLSQGLRASYPGRRGLLARADRV
jgi:hypothetical protein